MLLPTGGNHILSFVCIVSVNIFTASGSVIQGLSAIGERISGFGEGLQEAGKTAVATVANPIEKAVVQVTLKNCTLVKTLLNVRYIDIKGDLDTSELSLDYFLGNGSDDQIKKFNLSEYSSKLFKGSEIDLHEPVFVFIHGFLSCSNCESSKEVVTALKSTGRKNVFALDSSSILYFFYLRSSSSVKIIGEALGKVLVQLNKSGVKPQDIHLIGHSLGAQIASFAAAGFHNETGKKVGRISGLDPAGPCFFEKNSTLRLSRNDADFVDVIHTNADVLGFKDRMGDVDFYPNGGSEQPGCPLAVCNHGRAWELYAKSILQPNRFLARKCTNYKKLKSGFCDRSESNHMGFGANPRLLGKFYLNTKNKSPFDENE